MDITLARRLIQSSKFFVILFSITQSALDNATHAGASATTETAAPYLLNACDVSTQTEPEDTGKNYLHNLHRLFHNDYGVQFITD